MLRLGRLGALALIALALNGCALALSALGSTAGSGAGMGIQHNITGIVSKTYTASLPDLRTASLTTLERMSVAVDQDKQTEEGWLITGKAQDREISLRLQELTPSTTRARVAVDNDSLFKDTATAEEILAQTTKALDEAAAVQIENDYAASKSGQKKMGARQIQRAPAKATATKGQPVPPTPTKVSATREPPAANGAANGAVTPPLALSAKAQQKVALAKEHM
ncbi:MAG: DUF3568 family protein [Alphaproteobacteria bacterium]